ncbi:MAG: precorrin-6A/cobalt-precorrin-6A reductase [Cyanobium sp.]
MQEQALHQHRPPPGARIWLVAGTGEGPPLAHWLLERGWSVQVSVVSEAAARAYTRQERLEVRVGALTTEQIGMALDGTPLRWVIDASHPFASRISAALAHSCRERGQPLLRLHRPLMPVGDALLLSGLEELAGAGVEGQRLLLAIGARRLGAAMAHCPAAVHHARILPSAEALRQAMAAGLPPQRVACLRPPAQADAAAAVEEALCRRWRIEAVLARRSGGPSQSHWQRICATLGLRLLLLERPAEPQGVSELTLEALRQRLADPAG